VGLNPAEAREFMRDEQKAWRPVVRQFGVPAQ
jgi:hypothetical protein